MAIILDKPRLYVDFNELIEKDLVLLSQNDYKKDSAGNVIHFKEGMEVSIYMDDVNALNEQDNLIAQGRVELNSGVFEACKWNCRIDDKGIINMSDLKEHE